MSHKSWNCSTIQRRRHCFSRPPSSDPQQVRRYQPCAICLTLADFSFLLSQVEHFWHTIFLFLRAKKNGCVWAGASHPFRCRHSLFFTNKKQKTTTTKKEPTHINFAYKHRRLGRCRCHKKKKKELKKSAFNKMFERGILMCARQHGNVRGKQLKLLGLSFRFLVIIRWEMRNEKMEKRFVFGRVPFCCAARKTRKRLQTRNIQQKQQEAIHHCWKNNASPSPLPAAFGPSSLPVKAIKQTDENKKKLQGFIRAPALFANPPWTRETSSGRDNRSIFVFF